MTDHIETNSIAQQRVERFQRTVRIILITVCVLILLPPVSIVALVLVRPLFRNVEQSQLNHYDDWRLGMTLAECRPLIDDVKVGDLTWEVTPNVDGWEGYVHQYTTTLPGPAPEWTTLELTFEVPLASASAVGTAPAQPDDRALLKYIELRKPPVSDADFVALRGRMERRFGRGGAFDPYFDADYVFWPPLGGNMAWGVIDYFSGSGGGPHVSLRQSWSEVVDFDGTDSTSLDLYIMTDAEYMD